MGSDDGRILVLESNGELRLDITNIQGSNQIQRGVFSLIPSVRGFIAGCDGGSVVGYERVEETGQGQMLSGVSGAAANTKSDVYRKLKDMSVNVEQCKIKNSLLTPNEDILVCSTDKNQIYSVSMTGSEVKVFYYEYH